MKLPSDVTPRLLLNMLVLVVAYIFAARTGLALDAVSGFASLVWPASGVALAALFIGGMELWPAIWIGAFVANYITGAPFAGAAGIATGNTLEAVVGCYALRSLPGFSPSLRRVRDALGLILLAALASTLISATVGVLSLYFTHVIPASRIGVTWLAWWIGDGIGDLTVAPMMFVWFKLPQRKARKRRIAESAGLFLVVAATGLIVFGSPFRSASYDFGGAYLFFPILIWAALRFGPRGAVTAGFFISVAAIWGTVAGLGPFVHPELHLSLLALQIFVGVQAATFLILGASIGERRAAERDALEARTTAESANRAKSDFLAVVSHELRTPLNAIAGYAELLTMNLHGPLTDLQRESLERIQRNQRHLLSLIDDVLGFARLETGNLRLDAEVVKVSDAFEEAAHVFVPELGRKKLAFETGSAIGLSVVADRARLRQILVNLVNNAIKFTPEQGTIRMDAARTAGGMVEISVTDSGIGIAPEHLVKVFEPFVQADAGRARNYPGVGLGLSIVRDLVNAMNGEVGITSEVGRGTTVVIRLPEAPKNS